MPRSIQNRLLISFSWRTTVLATLFFCTSLTAAARIFWFPGNEATIQETIDLARDGDTVVVAEGRYYENLIIREKAVTLASEFILDGDSGHIQRTVIDGSRWTDSLRRSTISLVDCTDTTTVVKGLTITEGGGTQVFVGPAEHWCGGGIIINEGSGKVEDNIIQENHLEYGYRVNAGCGILASAGNGHHVVIRNNLIRDNSIETAMQATAGGLWAGVAKGGHILVEKNRIIHNSVRCKGPNSAHGGGVTLFGMYPEQAFLLFRDNLVANNHLESDPGGNNIKAYGAGLDILYYDFKPEHRVKIPFLRVSENRILHNSSSERGGGISLRGGANARNKESPVCPQVLLSGNTLKGNRATFGAGINNYDVSFIMIGNRLEDDLYDSGMVEIFNEDVVYAMLNHGIINAHDNQVQGEWPSGRGIYQEYPYVRSYAHRWKILDDSPDEIRMRWVPPAWRQWWAISLYILALVILLWLYRQYLYYRFNLRAALDLEKKEKERIRHLDEVRTRFFANISHEFRTPLTLISGPVEDVLKEASLEEKHRRNLDMVRRNVQRLQQLTNQLMDLSKLESGSMQLKVTRGDMGAFVKSIASSFLSLAESRSISYRLDVPQLPEETYFDGDKLEKILCNLLSNAFKFTPEGGKVELSMKGIRSKGTEPVKNIGLRVTDSGPGMTEDQRKRIFDRFYSEDKLQHNDTEGTGIGMSLVKELVELYRGTIRVESEPGKGTTFEVELPVARSLFAPEEISSTPATARKQSYEKSWSVPDKKDILTSENPDGVELQSPLLLVVEDNDDLRNYLISHLKDGYQLLEAQNGHMALNLAREQIPDLIISDLMMPEMDGIKLLEELRSDERTSHIPFIMLTARADKVTRFESFRKGTDEYIEKPFDTSELIVRISAILSRQKELAEHYRKGFLKDPETNIALPDSEAFMNRVIRIIQSELFNSEFSVASLSEALNVSRVQLYRKVHAITGFSPVDYIRNIRLNAAAKLFRESDLNVTQVMLETGFQTPSYFTECFRDKFGCNPSQYRKNCRRKEPIEDGNSLSM